MVERFCRAGFLGDWLRMHKQSGGRDPTTLPHSRKRSKRAGIGGNPLQYYIAFHTTGMKKKGAKTILVIRKRLKSKYDKLPPTGKIKIYMRWKAWLRNSIEDKSLRLQCAAAAQAAYRQFCGIGSEMWPIQPEELRGFATQFCTSKHGKYTDTGMFSHSPTPRGLSRVAQTLASSAQNFIIPDVIAEADADEESYQDASCLAQHPGICKQEEAAIFKDCWSTGRRLSNLICGMEKSRALGSMWIISALALDNSPLESYIVVVAFCQYGGSGGRQVVVDLASDSSDEFDGPLLQQPFQTGNGFVDLTTDETFHLATSYGLAKMFFVEMATLCFVSIRATELKVLGPLS